MKIRRAMKKDCDGMARLIIKEFAKAPYKDTWTHGEAVSSINSDLRKGFGYVIELDNRIVGFVTVSEEISGKIFLFIENLAVDSSYHRKGIGKKLIEQVEKKHGKTRDVVITLSVNKKSKAYKFYKTLGYKENKLNVNMSKKLSWIT